jgi:hypothetical protein
MDYREPPPESAHALSRGRELTVGILFAVGFLLILSVALAPLAAWWHQIWFDCWHGFWPARSPSQWSDSLWGDLWWLIFAVPFAALLIPPFRRWIRRGLDNLLHRHFAHHRSIDQHHRTQAHEAVHRRLTAQDVHLEAQDAAMRAADKRLTRIEALLTERLAAPQPSPSADEKRLARNARRRAAYAAAKVPTPKPVRRPAKKTGARKSTAKRR